MKKPPSRAGFSLVEMLVVTSLIAVLITLSLALLTSALTRRARVFVAEGQEQKNQRAATELHYYLVTAADYTIYPDAASAAQPVYAGWQGNYIRVRTQENLELSFSYVPGTPYGSLYITPPGELTGYLYSDQVQLPAGAMYWISALEGVVVAHWQTELGNERVDYRAAGAPRYLR